MLRNYLTIAIRSLVRYPGQAAINIVGLALGLAGCLMILSYVRYERSYDSWLPDASRLFQVQMTVHPPGMADVHSQASPDQFDDLARTFPQVEAETSIATGKTVTERDGQPIFMDATMVDQAFFKVFALPFAQGSAATALTDTNSIVITRSEAIRLFGTPDALGKVVTFGAGPGKRPVRVSGVLRDLPRNTSLRVGVISLRNPKIPPAAGRLHYVKLRAATDVANVNAAIPAWARRVIPLVAAGVFEFRLVPIRDVHLGRAQEAALAAGGDARALATFTVVALLTLTMAVVNFINLSTARAIQRAREVALRKVFGATRGQLIVQFLGESLLVSGMAMVIALTAAELTMPWIGSAIGADLHIAYAGPDGTLLPAVAMFLTAGVASGLYPAFVISRFRPADVLHASRGSAETPGSGRLRSVLVVVQFAIAIGLIASTAIIWSQTRFVEQFDPGYRRDGLVQIDNAWRFTQGDEYVAARAAMLAIPGVTDVGRTGLGLGSAERIERLTRAPRGGAYVTMSRYSIDTGFVPTMGVQVLAGRLLGDRVAADRFSDADPGSARRGVNVIVNRSAATRFGFRAPKSAVGQTIQVALDRTAEVLEPVTIVGVVEDTRFGTAREAIDPIVYLYDPDHTSQVVVRFAHARPGDVMAALNRVWRRYEPEIPFEARFADDIVHELYTAERARAVLFAVFSVLAVLIACLGLYSLAAFATQRRTKEIGIRKVLGATVFDVVRLLAWQFSKPVVIANLIAWPVAWWAMRDWLNRFDLRIPLTITPFALAGALALGIALVTVAGHTLRVARVRPVHALRYE
jgi:putative ABC transport system permease protein